MKIEVDARVFKKKPIRIGIDGRVPRQFTIQDAKDLRNKLDDKIKELYAIRDCGELRVPW